MDSKSSKIVKASRLFTGARQTRGRIAVRRSGRRAWPSGVACWVEDSLARTGFVPFRLRIMPPPFPPGTSGWPAGEFGFPLPWKVVRSAGARRRRRGRSSEPSVQSKGPGISRRTASISAAYSGEVSTNLWRFTPVRPANRHRTTARVMERRIRDSGIRLETRALYPAVLTSRQRVSELIRDPYPVRVDGRHAADRITARNWASPPETTRHPGSPGPHPSSDRP